VATITLGTGVSGFSSLSTLYEIINTLRNDPVLSIGSTTSTATWSQSFDDGEGGTIEYDSVVSLHGTNLNTADGSITSIEFAVTQDEETFQQFVASGFTIDSGDMAAAIMAVNDGNSAPLKAIFEGMNWTLNAPGLDADKGVYFQGTGGNDTVTLGASADQIGLDGGKDDIRLGGGHDEVFFYSALNYAAEGNSKIDMGKGVDTLFLDYTNNFDGLDPYEHLTGGMKVTLGKTIDFGEFTVKFKGLEELIGTRFTDTLTGTSGEDIIAGGGGGDLIIGGGGGDNLSSELGENDFYRYVKETDSKTGKNHDVIYFFEANTDVIDLSRLDPDTNNGAFKFVGDKALKKEGDLRVEFINKPGSENDHYRVEANLDNDKAAEFEIEVHAIGDLAKGDFML
jgi:Ca2+-binding RTX toxin-like protein